MTPVFSRYIPRQLLLGGYTAQGIDHLTGHHTVGAGGVGQHPDGLHPALRRHTGGLGNEPEGLRLEGIPRQHRQRLAVGLMAGRLSPPQIVVIHTGQVVVNEGVGVNQLQRTGIGQSQMPVYPTQTGQLQRQHWADALAAAQKAVPHGLLQSSIGLVCGEKVPPDTVQWPPDRRHIGCKKSMVIPRLQIPFPPERRRGPSSAAPPAAPPDPAPCGRLPPAGSPSSNRDRDWLRGTSPLFQPGDDLLQPGHILFKGLVCHHASSFSVTVQRRPPCASRK